MVKKKNIHVLPTDKPSRLSILNSGKLNFGAKIMSSSNSKPQNIYITSDEEIKDGDWIIENNNLGKCTNELWAKRGASILTKKIILTTDQDLINNGVQKIDDEFLEWFVKNLSCERVKVVDYPMVEKYNSKGEYIHYNYWTYKIIIPKEEPKQYTSEEMEGFENFKKVIKPKQIKCYCGHTTYCDCVPLEELKQERMYSEEEVFEIIALFVNDAPHNTREWFEQFKKK